MTAPRADVPLAALTTLGVGGRAQWYVRAESAADVAAADAWCAARGLPLTVLGGGSNVVVCDGVVAGLVLHMGLADLRVEAAGEDTRIEAGAGVPWETVVDAAVARGLAGLECLAGIPGSAGGTPIQNVGAYGQEVAGAIESVTAFDRAAGAPVVLPGAACGFGYRRSRFRGDDAGRFVVCAVTYRLRPGPATATYPDIVRELGGGAAPTVGQVRDAVLAVRRRKGMVLDAGDPDTRSVGSFFVNPVLDAAAWAALRARAGDPPGWPDGDRMKVPAAWLIERSGFARGFARGGAGVSGKHPLALVALEGGTAAAVVALAARIKRAVAERFGVWLRAEPVFVGFGDDPDVEFLRRAVP